LPKEEVSCTGTIEASAERVWSLGGDFHGTWHPAINTMSVDPAINTMSVEQDEPGRLIRAFRLHGEPDTTYRERLTWFSNSERSMAYTHVEGIKGVREYNAHLSVEPKNDTECSLTMAAEITAPAPRASQIAEGTRAIFDDAIDSVRELALSDQAPALEESLLGDEQSTVEDYCNDILRIADNFNADKIILCGLSYGAWIATSFATRYPDRLGWLDWCYPVDALVCLKRAVKNERHFFKAVKYH